MRLPCCTTGAPWSTFWRTAPDQGPRPEGDDVIMTTPTGRTTPLEVPARLTILEAAQYARRHPNTISRLYRNGVLHGSIVQGRVLISGRSLAEYLTEQGVPAVVSE